MSDIKKKLYRVETGEDTLEKFIDEVASMKSGDDEKERENGESVGKKIYDTVNSLPVQ